MRHRARARVPAAIVLVLALLVSLAGTLTAAPGADARAGAPGSATAGDPYFPLQGNGGYDVQSYAIQIGFDPGSKHLGGATTILARATTSLSRFDLDLRRSMRVSSVTVNSVPAAWQQPYKLRQELVITPRSVLPVGRAFTVRVTYAGTIHAITDPDGSLDGFVRTSDGGVVVSEPQGSPTWFPVNDTPHDKATYRVTATVPLGYIAVSNGALHSLVRGTTSRTFSWELSRPVSSYLVTLAVGKFYVTQGKTALGIPYYIAIDPSQAAKATPVMRTLPAIVDYFSSVYGRYPFGRTGAIVENAPFLGYSLETATRPVFERAPSLATLSHELAHQWFGDGVTLRRWRDIWLNEGFAEFSSWLWDEHSGGTSAAQHLARLMAMPASDTKVWNPPPADPGGGRTLFADSVYERGAGTLEALRQRVGSPTFFRIMKGWAGLHRYGNARVGQFIAYAESVSHRDLQHFFSVWLYRQGKPAGW